MMDTNSLQKPKRSFKRPFAFPRNCVYRPLRQIHNMERNQKPPADQPTCALHAQCTALAAASQEILGY
ncbi:uncharacterized protein Dvir_GJ19279, isoform B [Drosophila virilis]|uniref:Uncharacterized protein, isoform B n=1 Tax=Drosophila virilis TaxID=7244 RepID=A0A0Q9WC65_DROVI|nr:uncharacterized protein LOC6632178 isoform X2 [Drosophila virilis]KRF82253.1 uncharacterized protein Dvir_GJ19279, isoform B [Drosophila virilis]